MVVEHNLKSFLPLCTRAYVLDKGRVVVEEKPEKLQNSDILEKVFSATVRKREAANVFNIRKKIIS